VNYPKISIVTPSFNQGKYLEQTILSIINQKYPNLEYIIIDGGSTDDSVEIIRKYERHLTYWVSEKDNGQCDAINKGLNRITGELFNWINSDDYLEDGALFMVADAYKTEPEKKIFCFGLNYLNGNKKELFKPKNNPNDRVQCFCAPAISQPATFFSVNAIQKIGALNLQLHYSMDYEWWLKFMFLFGNESIFVDSEPIATFRIHEDAKTSKGNDNFANDMANILYSLSESVGIKEYSRLLASGFIIDKKYFFACDEKCFDKKIIERMVIFFLLKRCRLVYNKKQYVFANEILNSINFSSFHFSIQERIWLDELKKNATPKNWIHFRLKRKLKYIFSS